MKYAHKSYETLPLAECVALVVRSRKLSKRLLSRFGSELPEAEIEKAFFHSLEKSPNTLFENIQGIDDTQKLRLLAAFEVGKRYHQFRGQSESKENLTRLQGLRAHEVAFSKIPFKFKADYKEWIAFVPVHSNHELGEFCLVERGASSFIHFEASELYARLLSLRPKGYFLFHNHPSKNLTPSSQDIELTKKLKALSRDLGVPLVDHGVVSFNNVQWIVI